MKLKSRRWRHSLQTKFRSCVILFILALCFVSVGVTIVSFKSAIMGGRNRDAIGSRGLSESSPIHALVEPRQANPQHVEPEELAGSAGREIHFDPLTGKIAALSPGARRSSRLMSPDEENALSSASAGLVQVPLMGPAGGVKIDLQGRFRSEVAVTSDARSNLLLRCVPSAVAAENQLHQVVTSTPVGVGESKEAHRQK